MLSDSTPQPSPRKAAATEPDESWVGICTVGNPSSTDKVREVLDDGNIPSVVLDPSLRASGLAGWQPSDLEARDEAHLVMVPREFREAALLLLIGQFDSPEASEDQINRL